MKHLVQILIIIIIAALLNGCWSKNSDLAEETSKSEFDGDDYVTYNGPPPRTIDLDSVNNQPLKNYYKRPPKYVSINFVVAGPDSCPVKIDLHLTPHDVVRHVADTILAAGRHNITWNTLGKDRSPLPENIYYYQLYICGKKSTQKLKYRSGDFGVL